MPRGITNKGLATRRRIVEGAAGLLREQGVANIGLEDIRATTGISNSQLFHYFPNGRAELMLAVAAYEADLILLEQQPHLSDLTTWKSWQAWSDQLLARHIEQREQCGLSTLVGQLESQQAEVRTIITDMYRDWGRALSDGIRSMQDSGKVSADLDADDTAKAILAGIQGGIVMMLGTGSPEHLKAALRSSLDQLRSR